MNDHMYEILPGVMDLLMDNSAIFFDDPVKFRNFVLGCCVNMLGNLTLKLTPDDIHKEAAFQTITNVKEWFEIVFKMGNKDKEMH